MDPDAVSRLPSGYDGPVPSGSGRSVTTKVVSVGNVNIGGGSPVAVQTMWKSPLSGSLDEVKGELQRLALMGCHLVRFSVPDEESARLLSTLCSVSPVPLVADIHFDYRLAMLCMDGKIGKIRINPGNIGASWKVEEVVKKAADCGIPIRVGVNGGSLPKALRRRTNRSLAMVEAAEDELAIFERLNFPNLIFSLKSSDIDETIEANEVFASRYSYPLHLGVTEAGPLIPGVVKSSIVLHHLLKRNIGDTLRVSLSGNCADEVAASREILRAAGRVEGGINLVSCPRCGRASFDTHKLLTEAQEYLRCVDKSITVAVMGCIVNGPGESREADIGITGAGDQVIIYRKGVELARIARDAALERLKEEIDRW